MTHTADTHQRDERHLPVLCDEVCSALSLSAGATCIDMTMGYGGHAVALCEMNAPDGVYVGIDRDADALAYAARRLERYGSRVHCVHGRFSAVAECAAGVGVTSAAGIVCDLGVSSPQIDEAARGFSFMQDGPLDMRMDTTQGITAAEIVNTYDEETLASLLWTYGDERLSRQIARRVCYQRQQAPIRCTEELARLVAGVYGYKGIRRGKIHPATRTFQALRIVVNDEHHELQKGLEAALSLLQPGGRVCVMSYHSGEDRVVKHMFKEYARVRGEGRVITKKPLEASVEERATNPRARSVKMRIFEKGCKDA